MLNAVEPVAAVVVVVTLSRMHAGDDTNLSHASLIGVNAANKVRLSLSFNLSPLFVSLNHAACDTFYVVKSVTEIKYYFTCIAFVSVIAMTSSLQWILFLKLLM